MNETEPSAQDSPVKVPASKQAINVGPRGGRIKFGCQSDDKIPLINNIVLEFLEHANESLSSPKTIATLGYRTKLFVKAINDVPNFPFHAKLSDGVIHLSFCPPADGRVPVLKDISDGITQVNKKFIEMLIREGANDIESYKFPLAMIFQSSLRAAYLEAGLESGPGQKGRGHC